MATSRSARSSERLGSALVLAVMGAAAAYVYGNPHDMCILLFSSLKY